MPNSDFAGQVAMVTGAAYGLGRAAAEMLVARGASVVLTDINERLEQTEAEMRAQGANVSSIRVDVRSRAAFDAGVAHAIERFGALDILINNAGYSRTTAPILDMPPEEWAAGIEININGTLHGIQSAGKAMIAAGRGGRIVNIASIAGFKPYKYKSSYCVTKSGVVALTRAAALELAEYRITVNAVAPGVTDTETTRLLQQDEVAGAAMTQRLALIPLGVGHPQDISNAICFFASPAAGHVTGQALIVDGGTLLA